MKLVNIYLCFALVCLLMLLTSVFFYNYDHNYDDLVKYVTHIIHNNKHVELIRSNIFNTDTRNNDNIFELQRYLNSTTKLFDFYQYLNSTHHHLDLHQYLNNNTSENLYLNHYLNFSDSLLSSTEHNINEYILDLIIHANNQLIDSSSSSSSRSSSSSNSSSSSTSSSIDILAERIKHFDWIFYLYVNPDLRQPNSSLTTKEVVLEHFRRVGFKEDRWSNISESPSLLACRKAMQAIQRDLFLLKCEQYKGILSVSHNVKKMKKAIADEIKNHHNISVNHDYNHHDNDNDSTTDFSLLMESILSIHNTPKKYNNKSLDDKLNVDGNKKNKKVASQKKIMKKKSKSHDKGKNNNNSSSIINDINDNGKDSSKNLTSFIASILSIHDKNKTTKVEIHKKVKKFDWKFYLKVNPDLSSINLNNKKRCLEHYIRDGYFSNRWSSPFEQPDREACLRCMKVLHNTPLFHRLCHSLISMKNQTITYTTTAALAAITTTDTAITNY